MFKAIATAICAVSLGLLLVTPGFAERPGRPDSHERDAYCQVLKSACDIGCLAEYPGLSPEGAFVTTCQEGCSDEYLECLQAPSRAAVMQNSIFDVLQSPGVLGQPKGSQTFPQGSLTEAGVERACSSVHGVFGRLPTMFGCRNPACGEGGPCTLICYAGKCTALTPDPLPERVTLIGILQNGDNVGHGGGGGGGSLGGSGTDGGGAASPAAGGDSGGTVIIY